VFFSSFQKLIFLTFNLFYRELPINKLDKIRKSINKKNNQINGYLIQLSKQSNKIYWSTKTKTKNENR
jgi:hypothetical protein